MTWFVPVRTCWFDSTCTGLVWRLTSLILSNQKSLRRNSFMAIKQLQYHCGSCSQWDKVTSRCRQFRLCDVLYRCQKQSQARKVKLPEQNSTLTVSICVTHFCLNYLILIFRMRRAAWVFPRVLQVPRRSGGGNLGLKPYPLNLNVTSCVFFNAIYVRQLLCPVAVISYVMWGEWDEYMRKNAVVLAPNLQKISRNTWMPSHTWTHLLV